MKNLKYALLGLAMAMSLVMVAYAQEKSCEYGGKTYPNGHQVWGKDNTNNCWVCEDGVWKSSLSSQRYCKGKY